MAPLPHLLRLNKLALLFSLFASTLLASFFFVYSTSHSHSHSLHSHVFLGRRHLLANKNILDTDTDNADDFLGEVVPRKKKSSPSDAPIKKKSLSNDDDNDESQLVTLVNKKKSSAFSFDDDHNDKQVDKSKKNKSSNSEDSEKQVVENKKKLSSSLSSISSNNQTKTTKAKASSTSSSSSTSSKKDETKLTKPNLSSSSSSTSSKNKTKLIKPTSKAVINSSSSNSNSKTSTTITKLKLYKLNSTKPITKKPLDLLKSNSATKNKTKSSTTTTNPNKSVDKTTKQKSQNQDQKGKTPSPPTWTYQDNNDEDEDLVSEFRDLPTKFHQSFIPDLHRISTTSKVYLTKYNKEFTKGFKPYVGNKYAASLATAISCIFIIVPFLLVSLLFNRIKAYFSLQKLIIFIQIYLSIYFSILCLSSLITGLEPLRFFYATSQSTYIWLQVLQTLAYVLYLLLLLMYLVLVFSTETELGQKFLALAQTFVGFAVGLHYYMTVFHRVVLRQPPKTNWKIHGIYATCFLVICVFAGAERRKKAYLVEGSEEAKTS